MICTQCDGQGNLFFSINQKLVWMNCAWCKKTGIFTCDDRECIPVCQHKKCILGPATIQINSKIKNSLSWEECQKIDGTDHKPPNKQKKR